jgi:hypothetical protein
MAKRSSPVPGPLRPLVGGAVLVASVRVIDATWRRLTSRPTPVEADAAVTDPGAASVDAGAPDVVRDRLLYALLLGGATRLAQRMGLPEPDAKAAKAAKAPGKAQDGRDGKSPA